MWPAIVARNPGAMVEPPITIPALGARIMDWPATSTGDGVGAAAWTTAPALDGSAYVLPSMSAFEGPTNIVWPATATCPPGVIVVSPITTPPLEPLTMDWPPTNTAFAGVAAGRG